METTNWGSVIMDIFIISIAVYLGNLILIWLVLLTGGYKLNKEGLI